MKPEEITTKIKTDLVGTGMFLEHTTYELLSKWPNNDHVFKTYREYPYGYPTSSETIDGTIDVLATTGISNYSGQGVLVLPIECKKADPKLKHWVFAADRPRNNRELLHILTASSAGYRYYDEYNFPGLGYNHSGDYENAVNTFEFNQDDGRIRLQKDKELRAYYAIKQANESVPGILLKLGDFSRSPSIPNIVIPIVVTTANLWVAAYDPRDIECSTGDIEISKVELVSKNWVNYAYPNRFSERLRGNSKYGMITPDKRFTFVVNSEHLQSFVEKLLNDIRSYHDKAFLPHL